MTGTPEGWRCGAHPPEWGADLDWTWRGPGDGTCTCTRARCYCGRGDRYGQQDGGGTAKGGTDLRRERQAHHGRDVGYGRHLPAVSMDAPATSHALAARLVPLRDRTIRREAFAAVAAWWDVRGGLTDDDLETLLSRSHQSVSAARNALVQDGWLQDSGRTRPTRYGNAAVVWEPTPAAAPEVPRYARHARRLPDGW